jgi:hypothetical protein
MFDPTHHVYKADSTKAGKIIAMLLASRLLGPDWSRYAIHHYVVTNNAIEGVSYIQLQSKHATALQKDRVYLEVTERGGEFSTQHTVEMTLKVGNQKISSTFPTWQDIDDQELSATWYWLRLCGKDGLIFTENDYLLHPDNRC